MIDDLILSFPIIQNNGGDFLESVSYKVEATQGNDHRKIYITHTLTGNSFIANLIKNKKAKFSVALFYKDSAERQKFICDECCFYNEEKKITAEQKIDIAFSYAPEITANIVLLEDVTIIGNDQSGLTGFWEGQKFDIPAFSRIAHHLKLNFNSGDVSSLLNVKCDKDFRDGSIKTNVTETAGEGEQPITIVCSSDVFDELKKNVIENPIEPKTAMRTAIVTQVLCHVYAYMNNLSDKKTDINSGLLLHMEMVKDKTNQDWEDGDNFNASFAATQMIPYAIKALNSENYND